jgi:hypothetical protein
MEAARADELEDVDDRMLPSDRQMYLDWALQGLTREEMVETLQEWDPELVELIRSSKGD